MANKRKYIWTSLLILLVMAAAYVYREYNRGPADLSSMRPTARVLADSLVALFETDEPKANALYLGKPIEVSGIIAEITNQQDTVVNVILGSNESLHRVSCLISANHIREVKPFKSGENITLRGICNGYLMDVELNRCVVVKK